MTHEQIAAKVQARFWQSLAKSGVQIQSVPENELNALLEAVIASIVAGVEAGLGAPSKVAQPSAASAVEPAGPEEERSLWEGKPHVSAGKGAVGVRYELTNQRLKAISGVMGRKVEEIELIRVKDVKVSQGLAERGLGIGNVTVISTDPSTPEIVLKKIADPQKFKELIRQAAREEKQRQGLTYREFL